MPQFVLDPLTWITVGVIAAVAVIFSRIRHQPWWIAAMAAVGVSAFLMGMRWAISLGDETFWAAALATGGMALWGEAAMRQRRRLAREDLGDAPEVP